MLDKTITSALLNLRAQIIRGRLDGLGHVEALLVARSVDPTAHIVRAKRKGDAARKGLMRVIILDALRDSPKTMRELAQYVGARRPDISPEAAYQRTGQVLAKLKLVGLVMREGRVWGLTRQPSWTSSLHPNQRKARL